MNSHSRELRVGRAKISSSKIDLKNEWKEFQLHMDCDLFHTTALINGIHQLCTLIDPGSSAFATINQRHVSRLNLATFPLPPRTITGVLNNVSGVINQVARCSLDIGGILISTAWAYVVPNQGEDLILGMPWLRYCHAELDSVNSKLLFKNHNITLLSNEIKNKAYHSSSPQSAFQVTQVMGSTFIAIAQRAKKSKKVELFAASVADIEKALRPKAQLSLEEVTELLPEHYRKFAPVFNPKEAATLPPHRPGIDHEIPLEKDEKGNDKLVPWGPLYNMSHDELLVLRKELTSLLDKDFIQQSKSSAAAPVLFARKPGGGLRFCVDKLDVSAAFHRIRIAKGEEWKTAFRTRYGLYEWKVCPFGLTGAPATFQRYINWVLREYLDDFCSAYVDDILIFTTGSLEDHRRKVCKVLSSLLEHGLQLS